MAGTTLLCVGLYPYDVVHLITIARQAQQRLGLTPVFLDVAPPEVSDQVRALVAAAGFDTRTTSLMADGVESRNVVGQLRSRRAATRVHMDQLLDELKPGMIVAGVNPNPGFFLDHAAKRGVPTVLVQLFHWGDRAFYRGLHADDRRQEEVGLSPYRRIRRNVRRRVVGHYGFGPYIAWDVRHVTIAAQGRGMRDRLIAEGVPRSNAVVTGNPALDDLHGLRDSLAPARERVCHQLGLAADARIIAHMRSHEGRLVSVPIATLRDSQEAVIRALRDAAPDAAVVVKVHPKEEVSEAALIRSMDPAVLVVGDEIDTHDLLAASDVVVGTLSTTLLYAVLLDRPTVSVWLWPGLEYFRISTDWPGVQRVDSTAALTEAVRGQLDDPHHQGLWRRRRAEFIADEFTFDGKCTSRIVDLLGQLSDRIVTTEAATSQ